MSTVSYWLDEPAEPLPRATVAGDADVAIVGGGITRCSCALALAGAAAGVYFYTQRSEPEDPRLASAFRVSSR